MKEFFYPLAAVKDGWNAVIVAVDYYPHSKSLTAYFQMAEVGPQPGPGSPFGREVSFTLAQGNHYEKLEQMPRKNTKKVKATEDRLIGEIKAKSGLGWELLGNVAQKYGVTLADAWSSELIPLPVNNQ